MTLKIDLISVLSRKNNIFVLLLGCFVISVMHLIFQLHKKLDASASASSSVSDHVDSLRNSNSLQWQTEEKNKTFSRGVTQFGNCEPYCDRSRLKLLLGEFIQVYREKPFDWNECGCLVNHCAINFFVAKLSEAPTIVENGVNAGMSGYLFRAARPEAVIWHIDPLAKPICDPDKRQRWNDTGKSHYFVGPSESQYYKEMASSFIKSDGNDAREIAKTFGSNGFLDFFEVDWFDSNFDVQNGLVFFDTHQRDFDSILKARALGFTTFLVDDNYHTTAGDMQGFSAKQVFWRGGGQAANLAKTLDFYYEMPPIINPLMMPLEMKSRYSSIFEEEKKIGTPKDGSPKGFVFNQAAHDMGLYQEPLLDLNNADDVALFEKLTSVVSPEEFGWYNHMAIMGVYRN